MRILPPYEEGRSADECRRQDLNLRTTKDKDLNLAQLARLCDSCTGAEASSPSSPLNPFVADQEGRGVAICSLQG